MSHISRAFIVIACILSLNLINENPDPPTDGLVLSFGGDVMLGNWIVDRAERTGYDYFFKNIKSFFTEADISFCNLESPFTHTGVPFEKEYVFKVPPDLVKILSSAGIDVVSLANNHMMDYGEKGLINTMDTLKKHDILYCGAGRNKSEASKDVIIGKSGIRFGFLSYSMTFPKEFWAGEDKAGTAYPYEDEMIRSIEELDKTADIIIVSFHWGAEKSNYPKDYQIQFAHKAIDCGADIIIGHHPHVIQGVEIYRDKVIFYSLGNLVFGSYSPYAKIGVISQVYINKKSIEKVQITPISIFNREVQFQPKLLNEPEKIDFFSWLSEISMELNKNKIVINSSGIISVND